MEYSIVFASVQLLIAGAVAYIAWRQHKTAQEKIRLDLFQKRFETYRSLIGVIRDPGAESENSKQLHDEYWERIQVAQFLFDKDVLTYLDEVWKKSCELRVRARRAPDNEPERTEWINKCGALRDWFYPQIDSQEVALRFGKYLNFKKAL